MPFYKANQEYNATLTSDYTVSDNTLAVSSIPANTPTIITVARGTDKETRFTVTGTDVGQLTGVARLDGANDNIPAGSSVECMNDIEFVNQLESAVFDQGGLKGLVYAADGGSDDDYVIALPVNPASYANITGLPIAFKANTSNTGACTLNVNSLGAKDIKTKQGTNPIDGEIPADAIVIVVYDGTNFILQSTGFIVLNEPTLSSNSATAIPTQQSVKTYVSSVTSITSSATPTPIGSRRNNQLNITALAAAAEMQVPSGTPADGNKILFRIKDDGSPRALTYNAIYRAVGITLPTTTVANKTTYILAIYNDADSKWDCVGTGTEA